MRGRWLEKEDRRNIKKKERERERVSEKGNGRTRDVCRSERGKNVVGGRERGREGGSSRIVPALRPGF